MLDATQYDIVLEAMRVLFLIGLPLVVGVTLAGAFGGALQGATSIRDSVISYSLRLLALVAVLYFFLPSTGRALMALARMSLG